MGKIRRPAHPWNRGRRDWVEGNRDGFSVLCMLHTCTYINRVGQETREGRTERGREGGGGGGRN